MGDQCVSERQLAPGKPVECSDGSVGFETIKKRATDDERGRAEVGRKDVGRIGWWQIDKVNVVTEDGWWEGASSGWRGFT